MTSKNPLDVLYYGREFPALEWGKVALLCTDLQYLDAARGEGCFANLEPDLEQQLGYYFDRLETTVLANVRQLQDRFRQAELEVIHTHIQSLTADGRDRSLEHKRIGLLAPPGSREAEILPQVAPYPGEIVIPKTASGAFNCTNLNYVLHNLGITQIVAVGVFTNECIESTVRAAADLSYLAYVPNDATATVHPELHEDALNAMNHTYASITTTANLLERIPFPAGVEPLPLKETPTTANAI